jgi:hypothetical protein
MTTPQERRRQIIELRNMIFARKTAERKITVYERFLYKLAAIGATKALEHVRNKLRKTAEKNMQCICDPKLVQGLLQHKKTAATALGKFLAKAILHNSKDFRHNCHERLRTAVLPRKF